MAKALEDRIRELQRNNAAHLSSIDSLQKINDGHAKEMSELIDDHDRDLLSRENTIDDLRRQLRVMAGRHSDEMSTRRREEDELRDKVTELEGAVKMLMDEELEIRRKSDRLKIEELEATLEATNRAHELRCEERDALKTWQKDVIAALLNYELNGSDAAAQIKGIYADLEEATEKLRRAQSNHFCQESCGDDPNKKAGQSDCPVRRMGDCPEDKTDAVSE
jgi:chromosome segregation ATPase